MRQTLLSILFAAGLAAAQAPAAPNAAPARPGSAVALPQASGAPPQAQTEFKRHSSIVRDPFRALIEPPRPGEAAPEPRGPGKSGLAIEEITVQGVALGGPTGSVALVISRDDHTYFLRPGDHLHDGTVLKIEPNGILFEKRATSESASAGEIFKKIS